VYSQSESLQTICCCKPRRYYGVPGDCFCCIRRVAVYTVEHAIDCSKPQIGHGLPDWLVLVDHVGVLFPWGGGGG
jgi:hypothetical protein